MKWIKIIRFYHLGAFIYSDAGDLPSHRIPGHVPEGVAQRRYDRLMTAQQEISTEINQKHLGKTCTVLVEEETEENLFVGRTVFQAPEVDGVTYVRSGPGADPPKTGVFFPVRIDDALEYDLVGEVV